MALFGKILVPLDGSEHSINALDKAVHIAEKFGGKITLFHAYQANIVPLPKEYALPESTPRMIEVSGEVGAKILADAKDKIEGVKVDTILAMREPVEAIIEASENGNFDLIVMGARGLSPIKEMLLGSVSHGVTTHAGCPVLIVK